MHIVFYIVAHQATAHILSHISLTHPSHLSGVISHQLSATTTPTACLKADLPAGWGGWVLNMISQGDRQLRLNVREGLKIARGWVTRRNKFIFLLGLAPRRAHRGEREAGQV